MVMSSESPRGAARTRRPSEMESERGGHYVYNSGPSCHRLRCNERNHGPQVEAGEPSSSSKESPSLLGGLNSRDVCTAQSLPRSGGFAGICACRNGLSRVAQRSTVRGSSCPSEPFASEQRWEGWSEADEGASHPSSVADRPSRKRKNSQREASRIVQFYKTKMCPWMPERRCRMGSQCNWAHSLEELRPRIDLSKTKLCEKSFRSGACTAQDCRFAHSFEELRATGDVYKTMLCAFYQKGSCLVGNRCRYAHGEKELRQNAFANVVDAASLNSILLAEPPALLPSEADVDKLVSRRGRFATHESLRFDGLTNPTSSCSTRALPRDEASLSTTLPPDDTSDYADSGSPVPFSASSGESRICNAWQSHGLCSCFQGGNDETRHALSCFLLADRHTPCQQPPCNRGAMVQDCRSSVSDRGRPPDGFCTEQCGSSEREALSCRSSWRRAYSEHQLPSIETMTRNDFASRCRGCPPYPTIVLRPPSHCGCTCARSLYPQLSRPAAEWANEKYLAPAEGASARHFSDRCPPLSSSWRNFAHASFDFGGATEAPPHTWHAAGKDCKYSSDSRTCHGPPTVVMTHSVPEPFIGMKGVRRDNLDEAERLFQGIMRAIPPSLAPAGSSLVSTRGKAPEDHQACLNIPPFVSQVESGRDDPGSSDKGPVKRCHTQAAACGYGVQACNHFSRSQTDARADVCESCGQLDQEATSLSTQGCMIRNEDKKCTQDPFSTTEAEPAVPPSTPFPQHTIMKGDALHTSSTSMHPDCLCYIGSSIFGDCQRCQALQALWFPLPQILEEGMIEP